MKFDIVRITASLSGGVQNYSHGLGETPKLAMFLIPAGQYDDSTEGGFLGGIGHMAFGATDGVRIRCGFGGVLDAGSNHDARRAIHTDACIISYLIPQGDVGGQVPADTLVNLKFYTKIDESGDVVLQGFFDDELILDAVDSDANKIIWGSFKLDTPD